MMDSLCVKITQRRENGYAFVAALLTTLIMTSIGLLIFSLTSRDVLTTARLVGEKHSQSAVESCSHQLLEQLALAGGNETLLSMGTHSITLSAGGVTKTYVCNVAFETVSPPNVIKQKIVENYQIGGTGVPVNYSYKISKYSVIGESDFGGRFEVGLGAGYGPVDISTSQPGAGG